VSLSTKRYQVASITQNNHIYKDLVEYFRSEVSLNLKSQVNIQNASNNYLNTLYVSLQIIGSQLIPNYILNNLHFPYFLINKITVIMALTYPKKYKEDINPET